MLAADSPSWDSSGNGLLNGAYNFRQVFYYLADSAGDLYDASSAQGQINFDGNGHYTLSDATVYNLTIGLSRKLARTGAYSIASSGFGFIDSPLEGGDRVYATVSASGVTGSTTETGNGYNDLFLASPVSSGGALQGTYSIACFSPSLTATFTSSALIQMIADGSGNMAPTLMAGFIGGSGASGAIGPMLPASYAFSNGAGTLTLGDASVFAQANEAFFVSPDGRFVFGGATGGIDVFAGIRVDPAPASSLSGLFFEAGIDEDVSNISNGLATLGTWYGSLNAAAGSIFHHRRMNTALAANAIGFTFAESDAGSSGQYAITPDGTMRVGIAAWPHIGIQVAMAAPAVSGSGVFINPQAVVNSASSAPFTAGIAPGEWITIAGSNFASDSAAAQTTPMPNSIAGVQVLINGAAAPLSFVSPIQISALTPQSIEPGIATIQVISNGAPSNTVTALVNQTAAGIFTSNGVYAIAIHGDYSMVAPWNPAQPGETIAAYVDGMGAVAPAVADGTTAPDTPLSRVIASFAVDLDGEPSPNLSFAGLSPGLAATYQINFEIPPDMPPGDHVLGLTGPDSRTAEALITVGGTAGSGPQ